MLVSPVLREQLERRAFKDQREIEAQLETPVDLVLLVFKETRATQAHLDELARLDKSVRWVQLVSLEVLVRLAQQE